MTKETKEGERALEAPQKRDRVHARGALLIALAAFISILFTGSMALGVQVLVRGQAEVVEGVLVDGVRKFEISAQQWSFGPTALKVEPGDKVSFTVTSQDIMHGFAINELGVNLALTPDTGVTNKVVIPLDMPEGTYTLYCSIFCGIGHPFMKGNIIIGEPGFEMGKILPYIATTVMAGMFATFVVIGRRTAR